MVTRFEAQLATVAACLVAFSGALAMAEDGFVTRDGAKLMLNGSEYRAIGANAPDLFTAVLAGEEGLAKTRAAIEDASANKIAFLRFWASAFWPSGMKAYFDDS